MKHILMLYHNFYLQNLDNQLYDSKYDSIAFRGHSYPIKSINSLGARPTIRQRESIASQ